MNKKMLLPILFALGTAIFWGCYGPTIGMAQAPKVDGRPLWSPFKPYVFIGIAYLVIAIIGGLVVMKLKGDSFSYSGQHFNAAKWGFLAGTLGAAGAICLTSAMMISRGNALLVMPIVFGGAVSVTAIVSAIKLGGFENMTPALWLGILITIGGVVTVAINTPHGHAAAAPAPTSDNSPSDSASAANNTDSGGNDESQSDDNGDDNSQDSDAE